MLKKKLLTLACAVGILACGACFGPIERQPILRPLADTHTIQVVVTNASESHHLDADRFGRAVVDRLTGDYQQGRNEITIHATVDPKAYIADAVLKVTILKESARRVHDLFAPAGTWIVSITASATLTGTNGSVIWSNSNLVISSTFNMGARTSFDWEAANRDMNAMLVLANELDARAIYIRRP